MLSKSLNQGLNKLITKNVARGTVHHCTMEVGGSLLSSVFHTISLLKIFVFLLVMILFRRENLKIQILDFPSNI